MWIEMFETGTNRHKQKQGPLLEGTYQYYLQCEDVAGNIATGETSVQVEVDGQAPAVARAYIKNNVLNLITDEDSNCVYSFKSCYFAWENATEVMSGIGKIHTEGVDFGKTYHIKCKDKWGNKPGDCSIIVRPEEFH